MLPVSYVQMLDKVPQAPSRAKRGTPKAQAPVAAEKAKMDYRHLIGWRRVKT